MSKFPIAELGLNSQKGKLWVCLWWQDITKVNFIYLLSTCVSDTGLDNGIIVLI